MWADRYRVNLNSHFSRGDPRYLAPQTRHGPVWPLSARRTAPPTNHRSAHACHPSKFRFSYAGKIRPVSFHPLVRSPSFYEICCDCFGLSHGTCVKGPPRSGAPNRGLATRRRSSSQSQVQSRMCQNVLLAPLGVVLPFSGAYSLRLACGKIQTHAFVAPSPMPF